MPPKKNTTPSKAKAAAAAPAHGSYIDMVKDAIINLKERNGSSRQAIQKYIQANNKVGNLSDAAFRSHVNRAITSGEEKGDFARPKGTSGPVKLAKKEAKPAAATATKKSEPKAEKKVTEKKTVEKKTTEKKAPATKKATTTKAKATTTKAAAPKKAVGRPKKATATAAATKAAPAAKPKANASKPRKTAPTAAPAVEEEVSRVLGKTKSGRVTKTKAPAAATKATKKAPAAKKTAAAKKATTPKKKATPKKATPKAKA
ncbi:uncharacterized protein J4E88_001278 [Alternaria novae-zelandiae]|uniref:uncharacterized protein n=1 Tax=Alternaria ventricosa TaxID=1187951 RepID=UPI0020C24B4D|nr:uncharacterized protein J4E93_000293 [Alternaria ventricosa]XP_049258812.1 uncharacterized protein J4E88_001278 [Alternaria novae-zelandiae]KAI4655579.1 hypothetical protein J4E93_000293 [Alternaria ventricosa]KAI4692908.1 hypothetical protein J4E88_001278 [Alternaria novae-zelandiae]